MGSEVSGGGKMEKGKHGTLGRDNPRDTVSDHGSNGRDMNDWTVDTGVVDAQVWFDFNDRKVSPISILDLQKPFSGAETAHLAPPHLQIQALYMTPELRHGLYAVNPKELGRDD